jgi:hypothetical protein
LQQNENTNNVVLLQFILNVINIQYDYSFFQQVMTILAQHNEMCVQFIDCVIDKLFKGRNINIKLNDIKMLFRYCVTSKSIELFDLINKLLDCLKPRSSGGARTTHQAGQVVMVINYLMEYIQSKGKSEDIKEENIIHIFEVVKGVICDYLENEEEDNGDNKGNVKRKRNYLGEIKKMLAKVENVKGKGKMSENKEFETIKTEIMKLYENDIVKKFSSGEENNKKKTDDEKLVVKNEGKIKNKK